MNKPEVIFGITGSSGVLGSCIQKYDILPDGTRVVWEPFLGDLRDQGDINSFVSRYPFFDSVFHFGARVPVHEVEKNPTESFNVNVNATLKLLEGLRLVGNRPWFFLASSSHIYRPSTLPLSESSNFGPSSWYGFTKLQADLLGCFFNRQHGLPVCVGRIFSFSHPSQKPPFFLPSMVAKAMSAPRNAVLEVSGLSDIRDFSDADQIAASIFKLATLKFAGAVNIGSGTPVSIMNIVEKVMAKLGRDDIKVAPPSGGGVKLAADVSLLNKLGAGYTSSLDLLIDKVLGILP